MLRMTGLVVVAALAAAAAWLIPRLERVDPFAVALRLIDEGRAEDAVHLLESPDWQGFAEYRAGRYGRALAAFSQDDSVTGFYNFGTTHAQLHQWAAAEQALRTVLELDPGHDAARHNLELVITARDAERALRDATQPATGDGRRQDPNSDASERAAEDDDRIEDGADQGGMRTEAAETPTGIPGTTQGGGLTGDLAVASGMAGRAPGQGPGQAPEDIVGASGGRALDRASDADLRFLLGQINDDPARVLEVRLRAAQARRARP